MAFSGQNIDIHGEGPLIASFDFRREVWLSSAGWPGDDALWYVVDVNLLTYWHFEDVEDSWLSWHNKPENTLTVSYNGTTTPPPAEFVLDFAS